MAFKVQDEAQELPDFSNKNINEFKTVERTEELPSFYGKNASDFKSGIEPVKLQSQSIVNDNNQIVNTEVTDGTKVDFMTKTQVNKVPREQYFGMQKIEDQKIQDYIGENSNLFMDFSRGVANTVIGTGQDVVRFGSKVGAKAIIFATVPKEERSEWNNLISQELQTLSETNQKYREGLGIAKATGDGLTFDLGGVFAQLGFSVVSKSPTAMAGLFGIQQQQVSSEEVFKNLGDADKAEIVGGAVAIPIAALEFVGLDKFLKALKGNKIVTNIIKASVTESIQEGLQSVTEEVGLQKFGGREKELKDTVKDTAYSMLLGFISGVSVSSVSSLGRKSLENDGIPKEQAKKIATVLAKKISSNEEVQNEVASVLRDQNDNTTNYGNNVENGIAEVNKAIQVERGKIAESKKLQQGVTELKKTEPLISTKEQLIEEARGTNTELGEEELLDILETYETAEKEVKKTKPKSLLRFIKETGGIFDPGGNLKAKDISKQFPFILRSSPINKQGQEVTLDAVAERAWYAGYFPETDGRPTVGNLLDALGEELEGKRRVTYADLEAEDRINASKKMMDQIDAEIDIDKIKTLRDLKKGKIKLPEPTKLPEPVELQKSPMRELLDKIETEKKQEEALQQISESEIEEQKEIERRARLEENIQKELKETVLEKGIIAKGRYDYTTNKIFNEIRRVNKLTKETATNEIEAFTEDTEQLSEAENILRRFTLLKATGFNEASDALKTQVLEDIRTLKSAGKKARDQKDFEDLVEKNKNVEETFELVKDSKVDSDFKRTKILNSLLSATGNFESYLNVLGGKKLTDKFSVIQNQKEEFNAVKRATDKIIEDISLITNTKKNKTINTITDMGAKTFDLISKDAIGKPTKLSTFDVIDIYNAIKNENIKEDYYRVYGKDQIDSIVSNLNDEQIKIADSLNDTVKSYYDKINKVFIKLYNRDLPFVKNYWMSSAENQSVTEIFNSYQAQSKNPSFIKRRERTRTPIPKNAFNKTMAFIQKAEYFDNVGLKYREIERTFKDTKVKKVITDKRGERFYNSFIRQLDHFSLNRLNEDITSIEGASSKLLGNWVVAKIGLNPTVAIKQLSSVVNYAENMPTIKWVSGFTKGLISPKETFDFVWNNSEYIRNRYNNGYSEALQSAMNSANNMPKAKGKVDKFQNFLTSFTRMGDIGAIIYGGKPYIDYLQKQGMSLKDAINEFEKVTLRSQQSPFSSTRSVLQNKRSPFVRSLLAFSNTPNQYARKFIESKAQYARGEISLVELGKTYTIYGIVNPAIFTWLGQALGSLIYGKDVDEEKATKEMLIMMAESPIQGIPILNDFVDAGLRGSLGLRVYQNKTPALSDVIDLGGDLGTGEWIDAIKTFGELTTGAPIKTAEKIIKATAKRID